jgi:Domain of unknown function (DUF4153)
MKFPSIQHIVSGFLKTLNRFPFELLISFLGTIAAIQLVGLDYDSDQEWKSKLQQFLLVLILMLPLSLSVTLFGESFNYSKLKKFIFNSLAVLIGVIIFFLFRPMDKEITYIRFGFLFVCFHLLVSFSPFLKNKNIGAFWEFNKQLFLRILTSALYSSVLYLGLAMAIFATDQLFNLEINFKIYSQLWCGIFGIFNTAFFLSGVPADWVELNQDTAYPKALKIFTQYVLIPLATVYLVILLSYEVKIISQWSLPKGWVSWLIIGYAIYGILSILLIYPIRLAEGNKWINAFSKLFYFLLIPLIALLFFAIYVRVSDYGITEYRYVIIVLAFWLSGIAIYFLIGGINIKIIPISLFIISLLATWGPQSAGSISITSQTRRMIDFFDANKAFQSDKLIKLPDGIETPEKIYEIPAYLAEHFPAAYYQKHFPINIDSIELKQKSEFKYSYYYVVANQVRESLAMKSSVKNANGDYYDVNIEMDSISLQGFKILYEIDYNTYNELYKYEVESQTLKVSKNKFFYSFNFAPVLKDFDTTAIFDSGNYVSLKKQVALQSSSDPNAVLIINHLAYTKTQNDFELTACKGFLLLK